MILRDNLAKQWGEPIIFSQTKPPDFIQEEQSQLQALVERDRVLVHTHTQASKHRISNAKSKPASWYKP